MKTYKFTIYILAICATLFVASCNEDDDNIINQASCTDGIQNGDETGVDCGGSCDPCDLGIDFTGTFVLEDSMGRPGINTVFSGTDEVKNLFNVTPISEREPDEPEDVDFQQIFETTLETYHDVYAEALGLDPAVVDYETNILGLDAPTFTTVLANFDALQVAPNAETVYFNPNTGVALTGRQITDDVIDISLTLMFGGETGTRFNGENGTPQLTFDGVDFGDRVVGGFPYLENSLE